MRGIRADKCVRCKYHHKDDKAEDGWYCGYFHKWDCKKSKIFKDYSVRKKIGKQYEKVE